MPLAWALALPAPDPLPQPAPTWLAWSLLLVTFTLHLVAMNLALGGSIVALIARWRGLAGADVHAHTFTAWYAKALPTIIAATVSFGVAPLLFVQVLYGRALFGSSILMAWPWLSVFVLVIVAYYSAYRLAYRADAGPGGTRGHAVPLRPGARNGQLGLAMLVTAIFLLVAFIYANNMSLMLRVAEFEAMVAGGVRGWRLNVDDATLVPRYLHIVIGSLAVAGACTAGLGWLRRQSDTEFARWAMRYGSAWAALATFVNLFAGSWWLMSLPREVLARLAGGDAAATVVLMLGIGAALVALLAFAAASRATEPAPAVIVGLASLVPTLLAMVFTRDQLREAAFARAGLGDAPVIAPQWGAIGLFTICFVGAVVTIAWLVRVWRRA